VARFLSFPLHRPDAFSGITEEPLNLNWFLRGVDKKIGHGGDYDMAKKNEGAHGALVTEAGRGLE
jgi:hypothetical protein